MDIAGQEDRAQGGGGGLWDRDCYWRFAVVVFEGRKGDGWYRDRDRSIISGTEFSDPTE